MLNGLEEFCKNHQHTIAALGALSTLTAVVVSLMLAWRAGRVTRTRLKANVDTSFVAHSTIDPKNPPRYLTVSITNTGLGALRVPFSFFRWKVPFSRSFWLVNPLDGYGKDNLIPQKRYPVEIQPRASETFYVSDLQTFIEMSEKMQNETRGVPRFCLRHIKAVIRTDDGLVFKARISKGVRKRWGASG